MSLTSTNVDLGVPYYLSSWVKKAYCPIPISNDIPDTMRPAMGYRWMFARLRCMHQFDHGSYIRVVSDLDLLNADHMNWDP
jgi:hypothetical protein